jgi:uncharacterized protein (UPF0210 family)
MRRIVFIAIAAMLSFPLAAQSHAAPSASLKPKVRAITAFVRLDRASWEKQIAEALAVLRKTQKEFELAGYQVESLRITTQPVGELIAGLSEDDAVALLKKLDELSAKEKFIPNVGPGMLHDTDDPEPMRVLERVLSTLPNIEASAIIADDSGIHWKTIHRTAELVKFVAEHSIRAQGTFNFTASAMLKPLGPFYPASYHTGAGRQVCDWV